MTIFAVACAGIFPLFHVGRVWFAWFLFPAHYYQAVWPNYPFTAGVGRFRRFNLRHGLDPFLVYGDDTRPCDDS
jgi:hypothetical protein